MKKSIKKLSCFAMVLMMIASLFTGFAIVADAAEISPASTYTVKEEIYYDDFNDGVLLEESRFTASTVSGYSATEANGSLNLYNSSSSAAESQINIGRDTNGTLSSLTEGTYVISFDSQKSLAKRALYSLRLSATGNFLTMCYWIENSGELRIPSNSDANIRGTNNDTDFVNFFIVFKHSASVNSGYGQLEIYVDNMLMYTGNASKPGGASILQINHDGSRASNSTISIDNLHVYEAEINPRAQDAMAVTIDSILNEDKVEDNGYVILSKDLNLPTEGTNGSVITWTSSNENLISNEGKINPPVNGYGLSETVTMKAHFEWYDETNGSNIQDQTFDKEFFFRLKRENHDAPANIDGDYILYDDFSGDAPAGNMRDVEYYDNLPDGSVGNYKTENGELVITRTGSTPQYSVVYDFLPDGSAIGLNSGEYVLEYDIRKDNKSNIQSWIFSDKSRNSFCRVQYNTDRKCYNTTSGSKQMVAFNTIRSDMYSVKYYINMDQKAVRWSMWIDGAPVIIDATHATNKNGLHSLGFFINSNGSTIAIDNLKFYKIKDGSLDVDASVKSVKVTYDGKEKTDINTSGAYRVSGVYSFVSQNEVPEFVCALYNKESDKLESVSVITPFALIANEGVMSGEGDDAVSLEEDYGYYFTDVINVPDDYENYTIKVFRWDSIAGLTPVEDAIILE